MCSCHFQEGKKENDPTIFKRNVDKIFPIENAPTKMQKIKPTSKRRYVPEMITPTDDKVGDVSLNLDKSVLSIDPCTVHPENVNLPHQRPKGTHSCYSGDTLNEEVIRMETGIPTKNLFFLVVGYAARFKDDISYFHGWKVESIKFEDQILITLMKLKQNYPNLHLAKLFACSKTTNANVVLTFIHDLQLLSCFGCYGRRYLYSNIVKKILLSYLIMQ